MLRNSGRQTSRRWVERDRHESIKILTGSPIKKHIANSTNIRIYVDFQTRRNWQWKNHQTHGGKITIPRAFWNIRKIECEIIKL